MGHSLVFMPECHSTNDEASRLIESSNVLEGTLVITNHQTAGRGQRGNTWVSEAGKNLTFSLLIKPSFLPVKDQFYLNMAISLGLIDYLSAALKAEVKIKWPNDIIVSDKKICGILIENHVHGQHIPHIIVGIGLNVNQIFFSISTATSMTLQKGGEFLLEQVLPDLLGCLETRYLQLRSGNFEELNRAYHSLLYWIGEKHFFSTTSQSPPIGGEFEGTITGVDELGKLKVETEQGTRTFGVKEVGFIK